MQEISVRRVNKATIDLIKSFEGCKLTPYKDIVGVWTVGWGSTRGVGPNTLPISQEEADKRFMKDLEMFEGGVNVMLKVEVTDNQFGALVSFAYNLGLHNLGMSTLLRKLNCGDFDGASAQFLVWDRAGGKVVPGLARRRATEQALFNSLEP